MLESETEYVEQRGQLLDSIERGESDLREAVQALTGVARRQFMLSAYIRSAPLRWVIGAFLVGAWLGTQRHE